MNYEKWVILAAGSCHDDRDPVVIIGDNSDTGLLVAGPDEHAPA